MRMRDLSSVIPDLPWPWIVGSLAALVAVLAVFAWRARPRAPAYREYRPERGHVRHHEAESSHGQGHALGAGQSPEQRTLHLAVNEVRTALDRQAREMAELRAFWSQRLDELNGRIGELARTQPQRRESDAGPRMATDFDPHGGGTYGAAGSFGSEVPAWQGAGEGASWSPGPADQPVEVRDGVLVVSRSLPPAGYLSATGSGPARLYLNADVPLNEFSLPRWAAFFDLQGAKPYAAYRTRRPAEVRWDEAMGRGELISKGTAEAI